MTSFSLQIIRLLAKFPVVISSFHFIFLFSINEKQLQRCLSQTALFMLFTNVLNGEGKLNERMFVQLKVVLKKTEFIN